MIDLFGIKRKAKMRDLANRIHEAKSLLSGYEEAHALSKKELASISPNEVVEGERALELIATLNSKGYDVNPEDWVEQASVNLRKVPRTILTPKGGVSDWRCEHGKVKSLCTVESCEGYGTEFTEDLKALQTIRKLNWQSNKDNFHERKAAATRVDSELLQTRKALEQEILTMRREYMLLGEGTTEEEYRLDALVARASTGIKGELSTISEDEWSDLEDLHAGKLKERKRFRVAAWGSLGVTATSLAALVGGMVVGDFSVIGWSTTAAIVTGSIFCATAKVGTPKELSTLNKVFLDKAQRDKARELFQTKTILATEETVLQLPADLGK